MLARARPVAIYIYIPTFYFFGHMGGESMLLEREGAEGRISADTALSMWFSFFALNTHNTTV